ncbi:MAG TPA: hypothetical protein VHW64_10145 [Nocardioides sp.]|uniref:hypothetical protein n=1 Tax=Nocardioides sp. TaxID=35761 RepID=UPI002E381FF0|nr:hypothetical protein [Nocardioides sp.]HEX3931057.1 hypothetical protein [Nocardioides sp.]
MASALTQTVAEALGRERRADPVLPRTGGPAGNALLTAWTGLVLLVGSIAELLTLVNIRGLISWHVAIGALLVPPAVMKSASTGWRIAWYYAGKRAYVDAGPPPLPLRLLGPLVVASTLGVLGSGVLLVLLGPVRAHDRLAAVLGFRIDWVSLHQGSFAVWAVATGLHLLGRILPALRITMVRGDSVTVPGAWSRGVVLTLTTVSAVALAVLLVHHAGSWADLRHLDFPHGRSSGPG